MSRCELQRYGGLVLLGLLAGCEAAPPSHTSFLVRAVWVEVLAMVVVLITTVTCSARNWNATAAVKRRCPRIGWMAGSAFGLALVLILPGLDDPEATVEAQRRMFVDFNIVVGAISFLSYLALPARFANFLRAREEARRQAAERQEHMRREAFLQTHARQCAQEAARNASEARERHRQQSDDLEHARLRTLAASIVNDLLISAVELDGGPEDKSVIAQMLRTSGEFLSQNGVVGAIRGSGPLCQELQEAIRLLDRVNQKDSPLRERLSRVTRGGSIN